MTKARISGFVLLGIILITIPFIFNEYILQLFILTISYSMLGLAFALSLKVGLPRFDIGAWAGIGSYTTAMLMLKTGMSFWLTLPIAGLISIVLGYLFFRLVVPKGMMVYLLFGIVMTLSAQQIFASIPFFGGWGGTHPIMPPDLGPFSLIEKPVLYFLGITFVVINIAVYRALYTSKIGRAWNAIGSSVKLAASLGIDITKYRMSNVLIGNFFLAISGSFFVASTLVAIPTTFGFSNSVYIMMYVIVGGLTYPITGPVVGSVIVTFLPEYLRIAKEYEAIITSLAIILIIIFMPNGVIGFVKEKLKPWIVQTKVYALVRNK